MLDYGYISAFETTQAQEEKCSCARFSLIAQNDLYTYFHKI